MYPSYGYAEEYDDIEAGYGFDEDELDELDEFIIDGEFIDEIEPFIPRSYPGGPRVVEVGRLRIDPLILSSLFLGLLILFNLARDRSRTQAGDVVLAAAAPTNPATLETDASGGIQQPTMPPVEMGDPAAVAAPYDDYVVTQGPHGQSYGHLAIDLTAGEGAEIKSPINGVVIEHYIDWLGNTTLEIENDFYRVTLLHGLYTVDVGERVALGQVIGTESNQGNTFDMAGRSCRGRDCGYHTHLNIFDLRLGANVNPLDLISRK